MPYSESQFTELVAEKGGFDKKEAKAFLTAFEEAVYSVVKQADKAKIPGLGTLNCNVREKRKARNPATGETFMAPAKIALRFSIEKPLKDSVPSIKKGRDLIEKRGSAKTKRASSSKAVSSSGGVKRGRGRPKGSGATVAKRGPGRPKSSANGKRGPGRPKGSANKKRGARI